MSELVNQARGLIHTAGEAIAASTKEPPSAATAMLARIILSEAKKQRPNSSLLQSIDLDAKVPDWNDIRTAMNVVVMILG